MLHLSRILYYSIVVIETMSEVERLLSIAVVCVI